MKSEGYMIGLLGGWYVVCERFHMYCGYVVVYDIWYLIVD